MQAKFSWAFIRNAVWLLALHQVALGTRAKKTHDDDVRSQLNRHNKRERVMTGGALPSLTEHLREDHRDEMSLLELTHRVVDAGGQDVRVSFREIKPGAQNTIGTDAAPAPDHSAQTMFERQRAHLSYGIALFVAAVGIFYMFRERGITTCIAITCNVLALSVMSLLIRNIFVNAAFPHAQFVTASHALVTFLVGAVVLLHRGKARIPDLRTWGMGIAPVGCATALNLGLANLGLLYTNAHFYEMLGASGFLVTAGVGLMMGRTFSMQLLPPMLLVTMGTVVLSLGEIQFSLLGATLILAATVCRAAKAQIQSLLMSAESTMMQLDPVELITCTSCLTFLVMLSWSLVSEGALPWLQILQPNVFFAVLIAAANAAVLNIASIFVIRSIGPVAQQCIGQLKGVLCCIGAVAAFGEKITMQQIIGYSVVICGIFWYNQRDLNAKKKQASELIK
jgi:drug/metabolite transporter (DMT)-like permease